MGRQLLNSDSSFGCSTLSLRSKPAQHRNSFLHISLSLSHTLLSSINRFELNTCVEPPHNRKVTSLSFQPPPPRPSSTKQSKGSTPPLMAVTTSEDGKFKSWVMVGGGEGSEGASWACRSVGHYQSLPCRSACFSRDGSLLVTNFEKVSLPPSYYIHEYRNLSVSLCGIRTLVIFVESSVLRSHQRNTRELVTHSLSLSTAM